MRQCEFHTIEEKVGKWIDVICDQPFQVVSRIIGQIDVRRDERESLRSTNGDLVTSSYYKITMDLVI